jgi:hypothetical protein
MSTTTLLAKLPRLLRGGSALSLMFLLSNCSERDPLAPPAESPGTPSFVPAAVREALLVEVRERARLLEDGTLLVTVRLLCPADFVQLESGPLTVVQDLATGEAHPGGSVCTGHWEKRRVRVFLITEEVFQPGAANFNYQFEAENPETGAQLSVAVNGVLTIR